MEPCSSGWVSDRLRVSGSVRVVVCVTIQSTPHVAAVVLVSLVGGGFCQQAVRNHPALTLTTVCVASVCVSVMCMADEDDKRSPKPRTATRSLYEAQAEIRGRVDVRKGGFGDKSQTLEDKAATVCVFMSNNGLKAQGCVVDVGDRVALSS